LPNLKYEPGTFLERQRKTTKIITEFEPVHSQLQVKNIFTGLNFPAEKFVVLSKRNTVVMHQKI